MTDNIKSQVNTILSEEWSNNPPHTNELSKINKKAAERVHETIKELAYWSNAEAKFNKSKVKFVEVEPLTFKRASDWGMSDEAYALKETDPKLFRTLEQANPEQEQFWWTTEDGKEIPSLTKHTWTYGIITMEIDFKKFWFNRDKNERTADQIRQFAEQMINGVVGSVAKDYQRTSIGPSKRSTVKIDETTWMDVYYMDNGVPKLLDRNRPRLIQKGQAVTLMFDFEPIEVLKSGRGEFQGREDYAKD